MIIADAAADKTSNKAKTSQAPASGRRQAPACFFDHGSSSSAVQGGKGLVEVVKLAFRLFPDNSGFSQPCRRSRFELIVVGLGEDIVEDSREYPSEFSI